MVWPCSFGINFDPVSSTQNRTTQLTQEASGIQADFLLRFRCPAAPLPSQVCTAVLVNAVLNYSATPAQKNHHVEFQQNKVR